MARETRAMAESLKIVGGYGFRVGVHLTFLSHDSCLIIAVNLSPKGFNLNSPQQSWGVTVEVFVEPRRGSIYTTFNTTGSIPNSVGDYSC